MKKKGRNVVLPWLLAHVSHDGDDCLIWPFTVGGNGYGWLAFNGKSTNASRAVCELAHGAPPHERAVTAHSCDNRRCVNPRHLRWASQSENLQEMSERGRRSYEVKLTDKQVEEIRALEGKMSRPKIAAQFGVHTNQIYRIHKGIQRSVPRNVSAGV